ncbi:MAG: sulfite exporter TauE/SafE family protein [Spirulinaceae cyanobacterium]
MLLDLLLITALGFLGSFGHCAGMCGPLSVAFSLSQKEKQSNWLSSLSFHFLLNTGRILSYACVGAALGTVGSVAIASGQLVGIGSDLRQAIVILTGLLLIWFGLGQIKPDFLPKLPVLHPLQGSLHNNLSRIMGKLSVQTQWWIPGLLGSFWGLIPCGFLYAAQIKAAQTGNLWLGAATMLCFGLGTMPVMLGVGISASRLSASHRSQLFRLGGWVTLTIGILTLLRTDAMVDYTGHISLALLILTLIARPLGKLWKQPLHYRRAIGVGAFVLAIAHTSHSLDHALNWQLQNFSFLILQHRLAMIAGVIALFLIIPAACTSFNYWQKVLGKRWRQIHLLTVPALIFATLHSIFLGSHYLGELNLTWNNQLRVIAISLLTIGTLALRSHFFWSLFCQGKLYVFPKGISQK